MTSEIDAMPKVILFIFASLTLAAVASGASAAAPASIRLVSKPQTIVRTLEATASVSAPARLAVVGSPRRRAVVRFRLDGLKGPVVQARLSLYSRRSSGVFRVRAAGSRRSVAVWAPSRGWARLDVTRLVRGKKRVALVLSPANRRTRLAFKRPQLVVRVLTPGMELDRRSPANPQPTPGSSAPGSPAPRPELTPVAPTVAGNPYKGRIGVASPTVWYSEADQRDYVGRAGQAGMAWIREDFHWGAFERSPGVWNWEVGDRLMRTASLKGVNVLGTVAYSADWASSGPTIYHPPRDPAAYAAFCGRLVVRYGPDGTFWRDNPALTPRPLTALEIWNEPWLSGFWRPNPDPAGYVRLLRAAATAIRAADPRVRVLASADVFQMRTDTSESRDWFRLLLEAGPRRLPDARRRVLGAPLHRGTRAARHPSRATLALRPGPHHTRPGRGCRRRSPALGDRVRLEHLRGRRGLRQRGRAGRSTRVRPSRPPSSPSPAARSSSPSSTTGARCTRGTSAATARCGPTGPRSRCGVP